jgi:hypothetical protein
VHLTCNATGGSFESLSSCPKTFWLLSRSCITMSGSGNSPPDAELSERPDKSSVLVVDDNVDSREMFALVLETAGHTVRTA